MSRRQSILEAYKRLLLAIGYITQSGDRLLLKNAYRELCTHFHAENETEIILFRTEVAIVLAAEMGMDITCICTALLIEIPEESSDFRKKFGKHIASDIKGLNTIRRLRTDKIAINSENFIQLILRLSPDLRILLIQLADKLVLLRKSNTADPKKVNEITALYAPLAHRLGLYKLKSEFDELSMQILQPDIYHSISQKIEENKDEQQTFFRTFIKPVEKELRKAGLSYVIKSRTKSIPSIYNKMKAQKVDFEEVYDFFAFRIILNSEGDNEKRDCWKVYSIVTDFYKPDTERLRDWISFPKPNGYESLHTTVIGPKGKWVEVQIRTRRMDENAEKGVAAHWRYKELRSGEAEADKWFAGVRSMLENMSSIEDTENDEPKMELFSDFVYVFTPQGDLKKLKNGSTILDFAFEIHTDVGEHCSGAKVNNTFVTLKYKLRTGDQVEVMTSRNQKPSKDWLSFATSSKAISRIKRALKDEEFALANAGREMLNRKCNQLKIHPDDLIVNKLMGFYGARNILDFFHGIGEGTYDLSRINKGSMPALLEGESPDSKDVAPIKALPKITGKKALIVVNQTMPMNNITLARCCSPVPGDAIFGFITISYGIKVHRKTCPNAPQMQERYPYRILEAVWSSEAEISAFNADLRISGVDRVGILNEITTVVTSDMNANIRSVKLQTKKDKFEGIVTVVVEGKSHLDALIARILKVKGVEKVSRSK